MNRVPPMTNTRIPPLLACLPLTGATFFTGRQPANPPLGGGVLPFMSTNLLDTKFARIGARLKVADRPTRRSHTSGVISLDVQADRKDEFFEVVRQPGAEAEIAVLDVQPAARHLLLLVREGKDKSKFLCGHDERHWFVAGIPAKLEAYCWPDTLRAFPPQYTKKPLL